MPYIEALSVRSDVEHVWVIAPRVTYTELPWGGQRHGLLLRIR